MIDEILSRGSAAKYLLADETFRQVLNDLRTENHRRWMASSPTAPSLREQLYFESRALDMIETELAVRVENAETESAKLEKLQKARAA